MSNVYDYKIPLYFFILIKYSERPTVQIITYKHYRKLYGNINLKFI